LPRIYVPRQVSSPCVYNADRNVVNWSKKPDPRTIGQCSRCHGIIETKEHWTVRRCSCGGCEVIAAFDTVRAYIEADVRYIPFNSAEVAAYDRAIAASRLLNKKRKRVPARKSGKGV